MGNLTELVGGILEILAAVIALASAIAAITPTPKDDGILKMVKKVINLMGLNVGKAKPKE